MLLLCKVAFWTMDAVHEHKFPFGIEIFTWASSRNQVDFRSREEIRYFESEVPTQDGRAAVCM